ncbi:hypothetical protein F444_22193 [Phytophthora nicotianae P1976]|uniref:Uncharacterized protein n=1 Tax=Phytophthora nicotianae P1976 TaxID=1317066 RepID=A0A080YYJ8_PHYNI|nr:hypothetical protein F444_22193 [Phytophthora nicotianae P1976]
MKATVDLTSSPVSIPASPAPRVTRPLELDDLASGSEEEIVNIVLNTASKSAGRPRERIYKEGKAT